MRSTSADLTLPRRVRVAGPHRSGLLCGSAPTQVRLARQWAQAASGRGPEQAADLSLVVSELVSNALRHTRSGEPEGTVRVEIERLECGFVVAVTDAGPLPGVEAMPFPRTDPGCAGLGLRVVEALSVCWDWYGNAGQPLTVRALLYEG